MRFDKSFPAVAYLKTVRLYAQARGLNFFTWEQMKIAIRLYEQHAQFNN